MTDLANRIIELYGAETEFSAATFIIAVNGIITRLREADKFVDELEAELTKAEENMECVESFVDNLCAIPEVEKRLPLYYWQRIGGTDKLLSELFDILEEFADNQVALQKAEDEVSDLEGEVERLNKELADAVSELAEIEG